MTPGKPFAGPAEMEALGGRNRRVLPGGLRAGTVRPPAGFPKNRIGHQERDPSSNVIEIAWRLDPRTGRLLVISALDNLTKGASGQAVQSMNILCGFPETAGLV